MKYSCIYIDGAALWVFIALIIIVMFLAIIGFYHYNQALKENTHLKTENEKLRYELSVTQDKLYKAKFRVPSMDSERSGATLHQEATVTEDV